MDQTLNANLSHCIQSASSIGGNTYYNICSNTTHWVPWGSADWAGAVVLGVMVLALLCVLGALATMLISEL